MRIGCDGEQEEDEVDSKGVSGRCSTNILLSPLPLPFPLLILFWLTLNKGWILLLRTVIECLQKTKKGLTGGSGDLIACDRLDSMHLFVLFSLFSNTHTYIHIHTHNKRDRRWQVIRLFFFFSLMQSVFCPMLSAFTLSLPSLFLSLHSVCVSLHYLLHLCSVTSVPKNFALMAFRLHSRFIFLWFTLFVCFLIVVNNNEMSLFCSHKRYKMVHKAESGWRYQKWTQQKTKKGQHLNLLPWLG